MQTQEVDDQTIQDNGPRTYHLVCSRCVPVLPPVDGPPFLRWCGYLKPLRSEHILVGTNHPEACVVCANLENCATCGADRKWCH